MHASNHRSSSSPSSENDDGSEAHEISREQHIAGFWARRLKDVTIVTCLMLIIMIAESLFSLAQADDLFEYSMNIVYVVLCLLASGLLLCSRWQENRLSFLVRYSFMLTSLTIVLKAFDFEESLSSLSLAEHFVLSSIFLQLSGVQLLVHLFFFNKEERGHFLFGSLYILLIIGAILVQSFRLEAVEIQLDATAYWILVLGAVFSLLLSYNQGVSLEFMEQVFDKVAYQSIFKLVLDNFNQSILILGEDGQVAYSNFMFDVMFEHKHSRQQLFS